MKKIINILIILILNIMFIPSVNATNNISIESIELVEKSDNTMELSQPTINGMNLGFDLSFVRTGDSAKYKLVITNNSNKDYYIDNTQNFNGSNYVSYTYEFESNIDKVKANTKEIMYITIKYIKDIPLEKFVNGIYTEDNSMSIDLSDVIQTKSITNPITYSNIIIILLIFITLIITIIKIKNKKKVGVNLLLIGLLLIPLITNAIEKISIKVETKIMVEEARNIIESRYVNGNVNVERDFWQYSNYIKTVTFETKIEEPNNYIYKFDVSEAKDNSIIAYLVNNPDGYGYDLYIMCNGYIYANPDSSNMFSLFVSLIKINNLENYKTILATNMGSMFYYTPNIEELDLSSFDTSKVQDMSYMFCQGYGSSHGGLLRKIDLSSFDTSNVKNIGAMFYDCNNLTSLDLSNFDTSNVTNMYGVFSGCTSLKDLNVTNFNTSNVENMSYMFRNCRNLISLDISSFDMSKAEQIHEMFFYSSNLENIYVNNSWNNIHPYSENMFTGCVKLPNFNPNIVDNTNANTGPTGYLTLKSE